MEFTGFHTFSSLIEEYDPSFHLFEGIYDEKSLFYFDVFGVCMRDRLYPFYRHEFRYTFCVFFYAFIEVFVPISNCKDRDHSVKGKMKNRHRSTEVGREIDFLGDPRIL